MILSRQEEEQFLEKYNKVVWSTVNRFKRRMMTSWDNKDDLYQEAIIVLLKHVRSCQTPEELEKIPIRDMINAMCRHIMGEQVVSIPKRTSTFTKTISSIAKSVDYNESNIDDRYCDMSIDDSITHIMFESFKRRLSEIDKKIVAMKLDGLTNREISRELDVSDVYITRALKRIKNEYMKCVA